MRRVAMILGMLFAHIAVSGCYEPALRDCTIRCSGPDECAAGQACLADGFCASAAVARCEEGQAVIVDGAMAAPDAMAVESDAMDLCTQGGCPDGTCIGGVCTIDCSATGSCNDNDIRCPVNIPCHVICGDSSCAKKVLCANSASCRVDCNGFDACGDEVQCPDDRDCDVTCSGAESCKKTKCSDSCSCDVTCSGLGSCSDISECPISTCRVGNGCSSQLLGCNTCGG